MKIIQGIKGAPGISIAKVFLLKKEERHIKQFSNDIQEELKKIDLNVDKCKVELKELVEKTKIKIGEAEAEVFSAHILIISDPMIIKDVKDMITSDSVTAEYAVEKMFDKQKLLFESMNDDYMKERAIDIEDTKSRLLDSILNISSASQYRGSDQITLISDELTPSDTVSLDTSKIVGIAIEKGGPTSHATIIARTLGIPAIVGLKDIMNLIKNNDKIILDGNKGTAIINPDAVTIDKYKTMIQKQEEEKILLKKFINTRVKTLDGVSVHVEANVGSVEDAKLGVTNGMDGIGLFRTEFAYMNSRKWPTEEQLYETYKSMVIVSNGKIVTFRTLDIGGDKVLPYYKFDHEDNPFLGERSIRFSLNKPEIFRTQLRALIRSAKYGKIAIMFPMISVVEEFVSAKNILIECHKELKDEGFDVPELENIDVGMMIEVPASAIITDKFAKIADFFSIGTNDLIQYTMAADRLSEKVRYLYQPSNLSILRLINMTIKNGIKNNIRVAVCGELASNEEVIHLLLGMGLRYFSVSPRSILRVKQILCKLSYKVESEKIEAHIA